MIQPNLSEVFQSAIALPEAMRAELAERLWESLQEKSQDEVAEAWAAELSHRLREYQSGQAKTLSGSEVMRNLRSKYDSQP